MISVIRLYKVCSILFINSISVANMTERVRAITAHMRKNPKDMSRRRGLEILHNRRLRLMWYMRRKDYKRYVQLIADINVPDVPPPLQGYGRNY